MAFDSQEKERWSWTENRVHELRRLIAEGLTSFQIAKHLEGATPGSVRRKASRLGLEMRFSGRPAMVEGKRTDKREQVRHEARISRERFRYWPPQPLPDDLRSVETPGRRFLFLDLPDQDHCRWPMSHVLEPGSVHTPFCGCKTRGLVYCPSHMALARRGQAQLSLVA